MLKYSIKILLFTIIVSGLISPDAHAQGQGTTLPSVTFGVSQAQDTGDVAVSLQILALMTILSLAPAILMLTTSFTRIIIR